MSVWDWEWLPIIMDQPCDWRQVCLQGIDLQYTVLGKLDVLDGYFQAPNNVPNRQYAVIFLWWNWSGGNIVACRHRESFERLQSTDACTLVVAPIIINSITAINTGPIKIDLYVILCIFSFLWFISWHFYVKVASLITAYNIFEVWKPASFRSGMKCWPIY